MADQTLALSTSSKTTAAPLQSSDLLRVVRGSTSYKADMVAVATYLAAGMSALTPQFTGIELGHATDTTISRASAGRIAVEGSNVLMASDIGVTVQAYDADLAAWSALSPTLYSTTAQIAAAYQPLDADLTAWAAVNPSSYSTTSQIAAAYQPLDGDLTAIAALTTTSTGRALLTVADAAAIRTAAGLGTSATVNTGTSGATIPLLNGANTHSGAATFTATAISRKDLATKDEQNAHFRAIGSTDTNKMLAVGYDTTANVGWIQSVHYGSSVTNLVLQPNGGSVLVGASTIASAAFKATGTSGNTVPLLDGANTWSAAQTVSATLNVNAGGSASGTITLGTGGNSVISASSGTTLNINSAGYTNVVFGGTISSPTIASPTLSGTVTASGSLVLASTAPQLDFNDTNSTSTERYWRLSTSGNQLNLDLCNDAGAGQTNQLSIVRTGTTASASVITANGAWTFSGATTHSATVTVANNVSFRVTGSEADVRNAVKMTASDVIEFGTTNNNVTWNAFTHSFITPAGTSLSLDNTGILTAANTVILAAATTARPSLRIPSGTAPTSPTSGDLWYDGTNLKFRDGATTRTITWT